MKHPVYLNYYIFVLCFKASCKPDKVRVPIQCLNKRNSSIFIVHVVCDVIFPGFVPKFKQEYLLYFQRILSKYIAC